MTFWACTALTQAGRDVLARYPAPLRIARFEQLVHKCDEAHFSHPRQKEIPVIYYDRCSTLKSLSSGSGTYERMDESFRWMSENGYRPVIVICENASGMKSRKTDRRRGLRRLLQVYRAMGYRIVVPRYDRLTRNPEMMAWLLEVKELLLISIAERSILGSAQIIAAIKAGKDGRLRRESGKKGYKALVASGKGDAGLPNLEKHRKKGHKTLADRQRQDAIDCARDMERAIRALLDESPELKTASYGRIAGWLNEHGYTTATNGRYGAEQVRRYMKHVPRLEALRARKLVEKPLRAKTKRSTTSSPAVPAPSSASARRTASPDPKSAHKPTRRTTGYAPAARKPLPPSSTSPDASRETAAPEKPVSAVTLPRRPTNVMEIYRRARESEWELCEYPSGTWSPGPGSYRRKRRPHTSENAL